ncbi:MAG: hypothetical protein AAGD32_12550 [Planctomycetota bacterium]
MFQCDDCGKQWPWNDAIAGKKAKCSCGTVMLVPTVPPEREVDDFDDDAGMYDFADDDEDDLPAVGGKVRHCGGCQSEVATDAVICTACGLDFRTGKKVGAVPTPQPSAAPTGLGVWARRRHRPHAVP